MAKRRPLAEPSTHPADTTPRPPTAPSAALAWERPLWLLLALFALSGCSALIYEIVWFQMLELVLGSSPISLAILLATYMGGLGIGSLLLPRFLPSRIHPFRIYGLLELAIGALGILVWLEMPLVRLLSTGSGSGSGSLFLRALIAGVSLLPPTFLLGATLPVVARWVQATPRGVGWVGLLYGGNTVGAVVGCVLAGFYLLRVHDMWIATFVAAGLNVVVGLVALALARPPSPMRVVDKAKPEPEEARANWTIHLVIGLSGLCALGGEVVWTRLLALLIGGTVYTFSIILAVFLAGIALGSAAGAAIARANQHPRNALAIAQAFLILGTGWSAYMVTYSLPQWPINPSLASNPWPMFQMDAARCLWALLPAALLWGASFPLALAALATKGQDAGRLVGAMYATNTIGAIIGALAFSFLIVPAFGTRVAQQLLIGLSALGAIIVIASDAPVRRFVDLMLRIAAVVAVVVLAGIITVGVPQVPGDLIAYGRRLAYRQGLRDLRTGERVPMPQLLYVGEGLSESIAVSDDGLARTFSVSGKNEASTAPDDMRLQSMLGNLPALIHPNPRSVLIVGFGSGVTAGTFVLYPGVQRIVICEIEPLVPRKVAPFFRAENHDVVSDPRVEIVYDDARHFMLTTHETFDIITSDPVHPWVKGSAVLFSRDYYDLVRRHLNPGGLVTQWVPLYQSGETTIKNELATFFSVFGEGTVWANFDERGLGYDLVLLGGNQRTLIDLGQIGARLARPELRGVTEALRQVGFPSFLDVLARYTTRATDLGPWLAGAEITRDRDLSLQYRAGLEVQRNDEVPIFHAIGQYRIFPEDLITGPEELKQALKKAGDPSLATP
jgi:spermidine synthase